MGAKIFSGFFVKKVIELLFFRPMPASESVIQYIPVLAAGILEQAEVTLINHSVMAILCFWAQT